MIYRQFMVYFELNQKDEIVNKSLKAINTKCYNINIKMVVIRKCPLKISINHRFLITR